jgi:hypothetical protein
LTTRTFPGTERGRSFPQRRSGQAHTQYGEKPKE